MSAKTVDEDGCSCVDLVKVYGIVTCWVISISNKGQRSGSCRALIGQVSAKLSSDGSVLFIQNPRGEESTEHGQEIIPHLNNFVNVHFLFCILSNLHIARKLFSNSFQCSCRNWNRESGCYTIPQMFLHWVHFQYNIELSKVESWKISVFNRHFLWRLHPTPGSPVQPVWPVECRLLFVTLSDKHGAESP